MLAIDIGDPDIWIRRYTERMEIEKEFERLSEMAKEHLSMEFSLPFEMDGELLTTEEFRERVQAAKDSGDKSLLIKVQQAQERAVTQYETTKRKMLDDREEVLARHYQSQTEIDMAERAVGVVASDFPPALYVTRAIATSHPTIAERYNHIRAQIEIDRVLMDFRNPRATLTTRRTEDWAKSNLDHVTLNIQRLQVLQICIAKDPKEVAAKFGREFLIDELGLPPTEARIEAQLEDIKHPWMSAALERLKEVEPPEQGLLIDQGRSAAD